MRAGLPKINQHIATSVENFSKKGGEKVSNYVNAAGKAIIAPMIIMANPFTKEDKENRQWAAVKQPVEAFVTLGAQLTALAFLYKGVDKIIKKSNFTFKCVEDAAKDVSKIPEKILKACRGDKAKALDLYKQECNNILKDRLGAVVSAIVYLPVLAISNKVYPKIAKAMFDKNESKPVK